MHDAVSGRKDSTESVYSVLLVGLAKDEEEAISSMFEKSRRVRSNITKAQGFKEAMQILSDNSNDMVLTGFELDDRTGVEFLVDIKEEHEDVLRMVYVDQTNLETARSAYLNAEITNYIIKPLNEKEAMILIDAALHRKSEREILEKKEFQNVSDAIKTIHEFQEQLLSVDPESVIRKKPMLMWEFHSPREFNKFSFEIKKLDNADIEDIYIFENKYILTVGVNPTTLKRIR